MPSSYTSLLGLVLPVQGELSGTWGDTVNNELTVLVDSAVAGTTTLSTDADVTLTDTTGAANQARQIILNCTGSRSALRTITAPARSKAYIVINATTGGFAVKVVGVGPTTGVTIDAGEKAVIAWNGSDFVRVAAFGGTGEFTTVDTTNLEVTNVKAKDGTSAATIANSTGVMTIASAVLTTADINGGTIDGVTIGGATPAAGNFTTLGASGAVTLSGGTANGVLYLDGSKVATSGSALTFNGTVFGVSAAGTTVGAFTGASTAAPGTSGFWNNQVAGIDLFDSAGSAGYGVGVRFRPNNGGVYPVAGIAALAPNTTTSALVFHTQDSNGSVPEQMRLTSTGLGIGTSSPATLLDLRTSNGVSAILRLGSSSSVGNTTVGTIEFYDADADDAGIKSSISNVITGNVGPGGSQGGNLLFSTATSGATPTERMRLDSSGNLGLGVTPSAWATSTNTRAIQFPGGYTSYAQATGGDGVVLSNAYNSASGVFTYVASSLGAGRYQTDFGTHRWFTAPTGTAGNAITFTERAKITATEMVVNEPGEDYDFRVESDTNTHALFVEGTNSNVKIGGSAERATTVGTNHLDIFNGTAPVGTLSNGISIYSSAGEAYVMDAAGNATLFSPHDAETNEWIFKSKHTPTGKVLRIDVEKLLRFVNDHFGLDAVQEFIED